VQATEDSTTPGGVNAHLGVTRIIAARVVRQRDGKTLATYDAPMFRANDARDDAQLSYFRSLADAMHGGEPQDWEWIGPHMSQRMFGISEKRAKEYAKAHGGTARKMTANPARARRAGAKVPRRKTNPKVTVFHANPRRSSRAVLQSQRVFEIAYKHVQDGDDYIHKFGRGVCLELLPDGSLRVYSATGKRLWKSFNVKD
jgi:hypothetical protein